MPIGKIVKSIAGAVKRNIRKRDIGKKRKAIEEKGQAWAEREDQRRLQENWIGIPRKRERWERLLAEKGVTRKMLMDSLNDAMFETSGKRYVKEGTRMVEQPLSIREALIVKGRTEGMDAAAQAQAERYKKNLPKRIAEAKRIAKAKAKGGYRAR